MSLTTSRGDATVGQLCEAFGISRQAYDTPRKAPPRQPGGRRRPERRGPWVSEATQIEKIQAVVAEFPVWGVRKVWAYLKPLRGVVSRKRVWKRMKALGLCLPPISERTEPLRRGHVAVPESNRRRTTDLTTVWTAIDGTVALVPVMDGGDRVAFAIEVTKSQDSPAVPAPVEPSLEEAFGERVSVSEGLELRSDPGPQDTGAGCEALCAAWGLEHPLAPVGRPTGNAVVERFIQTLKAELIWARGWMGLDELREAIAQWLHVYNHVRPREALGRLTPAERRAENLGIKLNQAA